MVQISRKVERDLRQLLHFKINIVKLHNPIHKSLGIILNPSGFRIYTFEQAATYPLIRFSLESLRLFA